MRRSVVTRNYLQINSRVAICNVAPTFRAPSADFVKRMQNDPASVGSKEYARVLALSGRWLT